MTERPRISVLLPVRNAEATLGTALRSLVRQRQQHWECIVVDDGSRDESGRIAAGFAERDPRIRVRPIRATGIVAALNAGLAVCRAPWVARMDADDWMHRDRLAAQLAWLDAHPELSGVGCHVRLFPRERLGPGLREYERWLDSIRSPDDVRLERWVECPIAHPTLVVRRELLERIPYRDRPWPEDYDLLLRLLASGHALGVVPRRLLGWRDGPDRVSRADPRYAIERFTDCKAAHLAEDFLGEREQYILWGYGGTGRALRRALAAHGRRPSHIVELHPGRLGQRIHGAPVIPPESLRELGGSPLIASVAGAPNRARIRAALAQWGWRELRDFVCAA